MGLSGLTKAKLPFDGKEETALLEKKLSAKDTLVDFYF